MKFELCLMLAVIIPYVVSEECLCKFPYRRYTGLFGYFNYQGEGPNQHGSGTFHADVDGYYFRADIDHPSLGPIHMYKDNSDHVICYEKAPRHCDRNENLIFAFPKCISERASQKDYAYFYKEDIDGREYVEKYRVTSRIRLDGICNLVAVTWWYDRKGQDQVYYDYGGFHEDVSRNKSFYLEKVKNFSGLNIDEVIFG